MNDDQVTAFVGQWYEAVERATGSDAAHAGARARTLLEVLRKEGSDARFHAMSTKPRLLSLMCLMHRERGELPRKRVLLYEEAVAVLLEQWRRVFKALEVTFNAPGAEDAGLQRRQQAATTLLERLRASRPRLVAGLSWASMPTPTHGAELPAFETKTVAGLELVLVRAGSFVMGSDDDDALPREKPAHRVELKPFWLARTAVTNEQYSEFLKANPDMVKPQYWGDDRYNQPRSQSWECRGWTRTRTASGRGSLAWPATAASAAARRRTPRARRHIAPGASG